MLTDVKQKPLNLLSYVKSIPIPWIQKMYIFINFCHRQQN